jgi:hypothetical protein
VPHRVLVGKHITNGHLGNEMEMEEWLRIVFIGGFGISSVEPFDYAMRESVN